MLVVRSTHSEQVVAAAPAIQPIQAALVSADALKPEPKSKPKPKLKPKPNQSQPAPDLNRYRIQNPHPKASEPQQGAHRLSTRSNWPPSHAMSWCTH